MTELFATINGWHAAFPALPFVLAGLAILGQLLDGVTTVHSMRHGGIEANGAMARAMAKFGVLGALYRAKALGALASLALLGLTFLPVPDAASVAIGLQAVLVAVYAAVVLNNYLVYRKQLKQ